MSARSFLFNIIKAPMSDWLEHSRLAFFQTLKPDSFDSRADISILFKTSSSGLLAISCLRNSHSLAVPYWRPVQVDYRSSSLRSALLTVA